MFHHFSNNIKRTSGLIYAEFLGKILSYMSIEFQLTILGIKVLKRKEAKGTHEDTDAEGNLQGTGRPHLENLTQPSCVFTKDPRWILLRETWDSLGESCGDKG